MDYVKSKGYDTISSYLKDTYKNCNIFSYYAEKSELYMITLYSIELRYDFSPWEGWVMTDYSEDVIEKVPDIVGTWKCSENEMDLTLEVLSLNKTGKDTYEMEITFDFINIPLDSHNNTDRGSFSLEQPAVLEMEPYYGKELEKWYTDSIYCNDGEVFGYIDFWVNVGKIYNLTNSSGAGITYGGWIFTKVE